MADGVDAVIAAVLAAAPRGQQVTALCAKGDALFAGGELDAALGCFDYAVRLDVSHAAAWVGRARILSRRRRDNEALGCINRALDVDPRCADALVHKGHLLHGRGLMVEALAAYEAALGSGAGADAREGRAAAMAALGRSERPAAATPSPAPAPAPAEKRKSGRNSGRVDMRSERKSVREEAPKSVRGDRKSFASDPLVAKKSDPSMVLGPSASMAPKRPSMKIPAVTRLTQAEEDLLTLDEARALSLASRHVEALRKLEPVAKRCPSSREAWSLRGHILLMLKQFDAAHASAERVTRIDPTDQDALKLMVKVLAATNKDVRALETADRLLALAPQDPEVHRLRADCLVAAMRHGEAVTSYERVLQQIPDDPFAWVALGRTLRQLRRAGEARVALDKGLALALAQGAADLASQARDLLAKLPPPPSR